MKKNKLVALALAGTLMLSVLTACSKDTAPKSESNSGATTTDKVEQTVEGLKIERTMDLKYATEFKVDYCEGGYKFCTVADGRKYIVIPEGAKVPELSDPKIVKIQQPLQNVCLASTPLMCLWDKMGAIDVVKMTSLEEKNWFYDAPKKAMQEGKIVYSGKYDKPDYELMLSKKCDLVIANRMLLTRPETEAKYGEIGINVMIDESSLEKHPLGRTEWIKFYAALVNKEAEAEACMVEQTEILKNFENLPKTDKTVVFCYVQSNGSLNVRKYDDYVVKMIDLAGGKYAFSNLKDEKIDTATVSMEIEKFYETAKDADIIIYNSATGGDLKTLDEFLAKKEIFKDLKAVKDGNVWCMKRNLYQEVDRYGEMIDELHQVFTKSPAELTKLKYMRHLK